MSRGRFPAALVGLSMLASLVPACSLARLEDYHREPLAQTSFLYASDGSLITELHAEQDRVILPFARMPRSIRDAAVAIEDRRFWSHHGIDLRAILRAAYIDTTTGEIAEGGSTITQQLVKRLFVGDEQTLDRKLDEASLAWQLEDRLTKRQILTRYLNTVYFGEGAYGVQAAAQTFFGVDAKDLSLAQSATLAGLISSPGRFDPYVHPDRGLGRRNVVLQLMEQQGMIDGRRMDAAMRRPLGVHRGEVEETRYPYPYFVDYFKQWFLGNPDFGETREDRYELLFTGGLRITTTLDPGLQRAAQTAVHSILSYPADPDGALTAVDPRTGYVRAMVGGSDSAYWRGDPGARVNLATGMGGEFGRQTGSAFKPFALVAALENGIGPDTIFPAPSSIEIPLDDGRVWDVTNAEGGGYGSMSLRSATVNSVNTVYAQLIMQLGADRVVEAADRMGLRCCPRVSDPNGPLEANPAAVLGTNGTNPLSMASAYGTLATGGRHVNPIPVVSVTGPQGEVIWQAAPNLKQVVEPEVTAAADDILGDAVRYGTGRAAILPDGRPQIGKTGTADTHTNAWFVGAIPQLTTAVWVGYKEGQIPMEPPRTRITVFGGTWPAQIWRLFMLTAIQRMPPRTFPTPDVDYISLAVDVTQDPLCLPNEYTLPQNVTTMQFITGTEPTETCTEPSSVQSVTVPSVIGLPQVEATEQLQRAGFYVEVRVASSTQPPGTVMYQSPAAGTTASQTSTVTITVAKDETSSAA